MRMSKRWTVINYLIQLNNYKTYLEIGSGRIKKKKRRNFDMIKCENKDGIDPQGYCNYKMTSDEFFATVNKKYDIIFIDGLHLEEQVMKDILNSLNRLNPNGVVVVHDCNPKLEISQCEEKPKRRPDGGISPWNGTVWRAFAKLRMTRDDLKMLVLESDYGLGIIKKGKQQCFPLTNELTFHLLDKNRKKLLNLITVKEFIKENEYKHKKKN
jgi:hypothetical protein